jgi:hypothetical protein
MSARQLPPQPPKSAEKAGRAARLAEALRANLARRKAQKRGRSTAGQGEKPQ